ncbi:hypothetical protein G5I_13808 [Acromyrmex echinatior]|uniref:Uncharacterized protein n=1 Tax=Acromyrmex echinatior TaxID=103372 RepID=F4X612_ACREC|nr:hypothetical protein G5I_13808 [Acromyrmex echinatior]
MANCGRPGWLASQPFPDVGLASHQLQTRMKSRYRASELQAVRYTTSDYHTKLWPSFTLLLYRRSSSQVDSPRSCGHPLQERPKESCLLCPSPSLSKSDEMREKEREVGKRQTRSEGREAEERQRDLARRLRKLTDRTLHLTKAPQARYEAFKLRHSSVQEARI